MGIEGKGLRYPVNWLLKAEGSTEVACLQRRWCTRCSSRRWLELAEKEPVDIGVVDVDVVDVDVQNVDVGDVDVVVIRFCKKDETKQCLAFPNTDLISFRDLSVLPSPVQFVYILKARLNHVFGISPSSSLSLYTIRRSPSKHDHWRVFDGDALPIRRFENHLWLTLRYCRAHTCSPEARCRVCVWLKL